MVQIQDGSLVPASQLLDGSAEDPDVEGGKVKFEQVKDAVVPTYTAKAKMNDGSGRSRTYTFSLEDMNVIVHVAQTTEEQEREKGNRTEKSVKEVSPETDAKKNVSSSSEPSKPASTSDFRVNKHI
jgi:hypothetical protein